MGMIFINAGNTVKVVSKAMNMLVPAITPNSDTPS